jgi:hypothetical protein
LAYCTASDVRLVVETSLTDTEISGVIEMSDAEIDSRIGSQDSSDKLIKKLSMLLTAHAIKTRQPRSVAIGEYREDAGDVLEVWEREIERIYRLYKGLSIKATDYRHIEEEKRYPEG